MPGLTEAFFLPGNPAAGGQRLAIHHVPAQTVKGAVLHVHAFAEEMNKSRRMVALTSRALAEAGFAVLQLDLFGCGDSSGDLGDAKWADWLDDIVDAAAWLQARHKAPLWLWGQRAGCLLAAQAAQRIESGCQLLFWQPQTNGNLALQQFLRLKMAKQMQQGASKGVTEGLRRDLKQGVSVDVAGYKVCPDLARGFELATLSAPTATLDGRLVWLEVTTRVPAGLHATSLAVLEEWQSAGFNTAHRAVSGPPFWQTLEIEEAPELVQATVDLLTTP